jgi:hypothetical protein
MTTTGAILAVLLLGIPSLSAAQAVASTGLPKPEETSPLQAGWFAANQAAGAQPGPAVTAERKGFIIGIGGGPGLVRRDGREVRNQAGILLVSIPSANFFSIVTDFKVGYAPSDQLLLYYSNNAAFSRDDFDDFFLVGLSGGGVTYLMKATSPTPFVSGSVGVATLSSIVEDTDAEYGVGFSVGGGFEFARHWSVDGQVIFARFGDGFLNHTVFRGGINFLFY